MVDHVPAQGASIFSKAMTSGNGAFRDPLPIDQPSRKRRYFRVALLCLTCAASVRTQGLTGSISGVVQDSAGAVTPGVKLELVNSGTGQRREAVAGPTGAYVFAELLPGTYEISISAAGFKRYTEKSIVLGATERVVVGPSSWSWATSRRPSPSPPTRRG